MIAIGSDHGGFKLKELLKLHYKDELKDYGAYNEERGLEEPKVAIAVGEAVASQECEAGILICRSGVGMAMAANKVKGIRCAFCYNESYAKLVKEHNNANIITLGADFVDLDEAIKIIDMWRNTKFLEGIYKERLDILSEYENSKHI